MRRRDVVRRAAAGALVPIVLAGITACGGDSSNSGSPSSPSVASGTSSPSPGDSSSPAADAGKPVDPDEFLDLFAAALEGASTAHLTMSMKGSTFSMDADGDVDYSSDPPAVAMTMDSDQMGEHMQVRMLDGLVYLQLPMLGRKWVKMDLSDPNNPLGSTFGTAFDLDKVLDGFRSGVRSVRFLGEEDVQGESLRHYRVTLDPSALPSELDPSEESPDASAEDVAYDLWFDGDGRFRQMEADLGPGTGTMTMRLSDWGGKVRIEAPPSDEVTEMPGAPQS